MEFLRSFHRPHLAGKPVVASPNVGCFLRLKVNKIQKNCSFRDHDLKTPFCFIRGDSTVPNPNADITKRVFFFEWKILQRN